MRLAERLEGGEARRARGARRRRRALGAGRAAGEPAPGVSLAGQAARVSGICALLGAVAPVREAVPLDRPRTLVAVARRRRRGAGRLAAAREALAAAPAAADRVPGRAPARDDRVRRRRLRGLALHRHGDVPRTRSGRTSRPRGVRPRPREPPQDPIRVFVGVHAAPDVEQRAPARGRRARAARRVRAPPHPRLLGDAARLRQPGPGRRRGAPVGRRRRVRRRPVPRQAHAADAGEGADRGAHAPRAARGAAPARSPRRRRRSASTARASARGRARTSSAAAACARSTRPRVAARCGSARRTSRACRGCWRRARCPSDARVGTIRTKRAAGRRGRPRPGASCSSSAAPTRSCCSAAST